MFTVWTAQKRSKTPSEITSDLVRVRVVGCNHVNGLVQYVLSVSDFHPTSLLLLKLGREYVWFTGLLGDAARGGGGLLGNS